MNTCADCGYNNVLGTLFCEECGQSLTPESGRLRHAMGAMTATAAPTNPFTVGPETREAEMPDVGATPIKRDTGAFGLRDVERDLGQSGALHDADRGQSGALRDWTLSPPDHATINPAFVTKEPVSIPGITPLSSLGDVSWPTGGLEPSPADAPPAAPAVYLISETGRRVEVPIQDVVIVGREDMRSGIRPDVDLTLDGASAAGVSRRHCRLLHQQDGWYVEDLMSTNFTVLNGKPLAAHSPAPLSDGDDVRLGKLRLKFHIA